MDNKQISGEAALENRISQIKDHFAARVEELERRATGVRDRFDARKMISKSPWKAVGLSLGAGLLIGLAYGWRKSRGSQPLAMVGGHPITMKPPSLVRTLVGAVLTAALTRLARDAVERLSGRFLDHDEPPRQTSGQHLLNRR